MHLTTGVIVIIFGCVPTLLTKVTENSKGEDSETPSPEWIKYQQERNDPRYNRLKLTTPQVPRLGSSTPTVNPPAIDVNSKSELGTKANDKDDTSSRQSSNTQHNGDNIKNSNNKEKTKNRNDKYTASNSNGLQFPSISGFIQFIKSLKKTWMEKSLYRIENKIEFLHKLKENLMRAIEDKFFALWPEADPDADQELVKTENDERHLRHKRGILEESNINFPPEYALMSINFLTFAVFLIKLVMQVVNIIKSKHYQFSAAGLSSDSFLKG